MKVKGLDDKEYNWKLQSKPRANASSFHKACRYLLKELYPLDQILEELYLPGTGKLYLDFYLPLRKFGVEVDGQQHSKYVEFFNGHDKMNYYRALKRDRQKKEWCELNNITLIRVSAGESIDEWRTKLCDGR